MVEQLNEFDTLNKLFCTFTQPEELDSTIATINRKYSIIFNKIFILESPQSNEYICTYNIDTGNTNGLMPNTILVHRKKDTNTLYTINALNTLIKSLNNGVLDTHYKVDWVDYKNSILLTQESSLRRLDTAIHRIVSVSSN